MQDSNLKKIVGVLVEPTKTFEAIARRPTWLPALLVLIALAAAVALLVVQHTDVGDFLRQSAAQSGKPIDAEQLDQSVAIAHRFAWIAALLGVVVVGPLTYLAAALVFWLAFKALGSDLDYRRSLSVSTHAFMPWSVQALLAILILYLSGGQLTDQQVQRGTLVASNLAAFAPPDTGPAMLTFLGSVDLFSLWSLVLLSIGFAVVAGVSRSKASGLVVSVWLFYLVLKTGFVAMSV